MGDVLVYQNVRYFEELDENQTTGYTNQDKILEVQERVQKSQALSKVLAMLPIVRVQLNSNQQQILNSPNNLFILGRSGTGKTTTTVLRFFCQETLFLALRKQERLMNYYERLGLLQKMRQTKRRLPKLTPADIEQPSNIKMVFVTASPVLTNEVKQYYASLRQQLAAHLAVVEKARTESDDQGAEEAKEAKEELVSEREKLLKFLEIREQEII